MCLYFCLKYILPKRRRIEELTPKAPISVSHTLWNTSNIKHFEA
jgi:hypothetical protein